VEIIPQVHRIPNVTGANSYLLLGHTLALVDTGMPGNAGRILQAIRNLGRQPDDLTLIVITHYHVDHIGSLQAMTAATGAQVLAHRDEIPIIAGQRPQPVPRGALFGLLFRLVPAMSRFDPAPVDVPLEDGQRLDLLGGAVVVHAPGHTPGSIALHFPGERLLITGDVINRRANRLGPPPRPFTLDMAQALESMRRLAALDFGVLCTGHGDPIVGGADEQLRAWLQQLH